MTNRVPCGSATPRTWPYGRLCLRKDSAPVARLVSNILSCPFLIWSASSASFSCLPAQLFDTAESVRPQTRLIAATSAGMFQLPLMSFVSSSALQSFCTFLIVDTYAQLLYVSGVLLTRVQSRSSCMAAHAVDPQEGEHIVDCCAAPGNKTSHLSGAHALCLSTLWQIWLRNGSG